MNKIKSPHDNKDRIICVATDGYNDFYYQPVGTKDRYWLTRCEFSGSIFDHFRSKGRNLESLGFSLSIRELYKSSRDNVKLVRLMDRIPGQVDYVIREYILSNQAVEKRSVPVHISHCERYDSCEYEFAA